VAGVRDVTDDSFETEVLGAGRPVVVDFWAPWCGPCKAVTSALEQLAESSTQVDFVQLDVDANPVVAARYDVLSLPTVIVFKDGEPRETLVGPRPRAQYERALAALS
jgi:thioredoxin 1